MNLGNLIGYSVLLLLIGGVVFWIWLIYDCFTKEVEDRAAWMLVLIFTGFIGVLIYWLVRRPKRVRQYGK